MRAQSVISQSDCQQDNECRRQSRIRPSSAEDAPAQSGIRRPIAGPTTGKNGFHASSADSWMRYTKMSPIHEPSPLMPGQSLKGKTRRTCEQRPGWRGRLTAVLTFKTSNTAVGSIAGSIAVSVPISIVVPMGRALPLTLRPRRAAGCPALRAALQRGWRSRHFTVVFDGQPLPGASPAEARAAPWRARSLAVLPP